MERSLLAFPDAPYGRCWSIFGGIWLSMKAPKYFLLLGSPSTKRDSRGLAFGHLLAGRIPRCRWLLWPHTSCCLLPQTQTHFLALAELYLLAFSWWWPAPAVTRGIHRISSTLQVALVCILASLLHGGLGRIQKTCSRASCSSFFWCTCCSARPSCPEHSCGS